MDLSAPFLYTSWALPGALKFLSLIRNEHSQWLASQILTQNYAWENGEDISGVRGLSPPALVLSWWRPQTGHVEAKNNRDKLFPIVSGPMFKVVFLCWELHFPHDFPKNSACLSIVFWNCLVNLILRPPCSDGSAQVQDTIAICPAVASQKVAMAALESGRQWVWGSPVWVPGSRWKCGGETSPEESLTRDDVPYLNVGVRKEARHYIWFWSYLRLKTEIPMVCWTLVHHWFLLAMSWFCLVTYPQGLIFEIFKIWFWIMSKFGPDLPEPGSCPCASLAKERSRHRAEREPSPGRGRGRGDLGERCRGRRGRKLKAFDLGVLQFITKRWVFYIFYPSPRPIETPEFQRTPCKSM